MSEMIKKVVNELEGMQRVNGSHGKPALEMHRVLKWGIRKEVYYHIKSSSLSYEACLGFRELAVLLQMSTMLAFRENAKSETVGCVALDF